MGSFAHTIGDDVRDRRTAAMPAATKTVVAAELRDRGLNSIAASLEGSVRSQRGSDRQDLKSQRGASAQ